MSLLNGKVSISGSESHSLSKLYKINATFSDYNIADIYTD